MKKPLLLVLLLTVIVYAGSFRAGWHLDDNRTIVKNESIDDARRALVRLVTTNRGLGDLTFTVNHRLGGSDPAAYHAVNLAFHLGCGVLVYLLVAGLGRGERRFEMAALGAASLFLVHPLATNSVTYVVQRYTTMAAFFYLLSAVLYRGGALGSRKAAILSVVAALAAARSKEIALTLPLALAALEYTFPTSRSRRRYLRVLPQAAAVLVIPVTLLAGRIGLGDSLSEAMREGSRETTVIPRAPYLLTQFHVVVDYLRLLLFPRGLTIDHDVVIRTDPFAVATVLRALFLASLAGAAFAVKRKRPLVTFGLLWFFVSLLVESSIFPIRDVMFEHRTYLPSVGFFAAVAALVLRPERRPSFWAAILGVIVVALGIATGERNRVWRDDISLWTDATAKAPGKGRPWANLGYARVDRGEIEKATGALEKSIELGPVFPEDLVTLAEVYFDLGRKDEAEAALREALRRRPDYARAERNLAALLQSSGEEDAAIRAAETATVRDPDYGEGWAFLARLRLNEGDEAGAEQAALRGTEAADGAAAPFAVLAFLAARRGDADEALRFLESWASARLPGSPDDAARVAQTLWDAGDTSEALLALATGRLAFPDDASLAYYAGAISLATGDPSKALEAAEDAVRLGPADTSFRLLLARALAENGQNDRARRELREVLRKDPNQTEAKALMDQIPVAP